MKTKYFRRILVLLLAVMMAAAVPMEAYAAKAIKTTAYRERAKSKAVKTGKQKIKLMPDDKYDIQPVGYVKFTASKTKTYKFTFKNLRTTDQSSSEWSGVIYVEFENKNSGDITYEVDGEEDRYFDVYSERVGKNSSHPEDFLSSRIVTIKLKKGQTIYICLQGTYVHAKHLVDLIIK